MNGSGLVGEVGVRKKEDSKQRRQSVPRPRVEGSEQSEEAAEGPCGWGVGERWWVTRSAARPSLWALLQRR